MEGKVRQVCDGLIALIIAGALMVAEGSPAEAQTGTLTLRPREMATATRTAKAGKQTLDGEPLPPGFNTNSSTVYVPEQCVGAQRCPLLLMTNMPEKYYHHIATKYGMIVAALASMHPLIPDDTTTAALDEELRHLLRTFAIDPDKIAKLNDGRVPILR